MYIQWHEGKAINSLPRLSVTKIQQKKHYKVISVDLVQRVEFCSSTSALIGWKTWVESAHMASIWSPLVSLFLQAENLINPQSTLGDWTCTFCLFAFSDSQYINQLKPLACESFPSGFIVLVLIIVLSAHNMISVFNYHRMWSTRQVQWMTSTKYFS